VKPAEEKESAAVRKICRKGLPGLSHIHKLCAQWKYTGGVVASRSLWSRYDRHLVGITRYNALS